MVAVRAVREGDGYRVTHMVEEALPFTPFLNAMPEIGAGEILSQAMRRVAASIPQSYWPLQIALPDPAAIFQVMELELLPDTLQEREELAQFRLGKLFPTLTEMQCTTQVISKAGDEQELLLATFVRRAWLECLNTACRSAGFVPSVIDISTSHLFNRFYDVVEESSADGVLILVEPASWSLLVWDKESRPRFVRSRWRDSNRGDDEYGGIVRDAERLILSYVARVPGCRISKVCLCADDVDCAPLAALLDKRMQIPCVQLDAAEQFSAVSDLSLKNIPPGVLAAVVPRL